MYANEGTSESSPFPGDPVQGIAYGELDDDIGVRCAQTHTQTRVEVGD